MVMLRKSYLIKYLLGKLKSTLFF